MKKILPIFSYLFHPIFIPLFGTIFYLYYIEILFPQDKLLLVFQVIIITLFLPLSFFYLLRTIGKIDNMMLSDINQRKIPLLLQIALTSVLIKQSISIERFSELYYFFLAGLISTILAFILLFVKIKSSIHMIGISALTFFVIGLSYHTQENNIPLIAGLFFTNGLIAASRLAMKAHTMIELLIGYLIGMLPQIALGYLWL